MIAYNLSIKISTSINDDWLQWQKQIHIPEVMSFGYFTDYKFFRLLEQAETDAVTYIVQYFAQSFKDYQKYIDGPAVLLRKKISEK
jgi:hypothetical protein